MPCPARWLVAASCLLASAPALAQDASPDAADASTIPDAGAADAMYSVDYPGMGCPAGSIGCASTPIAYDHRVGLPIEFDFDTGWVPSGSPVQVRFHTALAGHTEVSAAGTLLASWPSPMVLRAPGTPGTGMLSSDFGVQLEALVRLHLDTGAGVFDWEGSLPYVPMIDFRAMSSTAFDPWAWGGVTTHGATMRQHIADIPITDLIVSIPGVSGGLSFDALADLTTAYRSTQISFGGEADPITASTDHVMAVFTAGPVVEYFPRLEGHVDWTVLLHVYPSLYVSLAGHRWMVDLFDIPIPLGPFASDWLFDPYPAVLALPDVDRSEQVIDFGNVTIGDRVSRDAMFRSVGAQPVWVIAPPTREPFWYPTPQVRIAGLSTATLPVTFIPTDVGAIEQRVAFQTDDPDTPQLFVTLRGNGVAPEDAGVDAASPDVAVSHDGGGDAGGVREAGLDGGTGAMRGGCGCRSAGSSRASLGAGLLAMLFVGIGRRRRTGRPRD